MDASSVMEQYVSDLTNLPAEITYILEELKDKDTKFYETRRRNQQRDNQIHKFIKTHGSLAENPKEAGAYPKIRADFEKAMDIQEEKLDLAYTGLFIMSRHIKKLNDDIKKLEEEGLLPPLPDGSLNSFLNMDLDMNNSAPDSPSSGASPANGSSAGGTGGGGGTGRSKSAAHNGGASSASSVTPRGSTPVSSRPLKRSRVSAGLSSGDHRTNNHPPKTHRQVSATGVATEGGASASAGSGGAGDEEEVLYCFCQQGSFGNMVACDNPDCQFEWFHYTCVGLTEPPSGTWYCSDCTRKLRDSGEFKETKRRR